MIDAAAYLRMSTDDQSASIPDQKRSIVEYAKMHGYRIVAEYSDPGISGDNTSKRKGFRRMLDDAAVGRFRVILVWDLSRFGRFDSLEAGYWMHPLRESGVQIVTLDRGAIDWHDFGGRIVHAVEQEAKHGYLAQISRDVCRGMTQAAKQGKWLSQRPYGFTVIDGMLAIGPPGEVEFIRSLYCTCISGESLRSIADRLNATGSRSPRGAMWSSTTLYKMLANPLYRGEQQWGKRRTGKYFSAGENAAQARTTRGDERRNPVVSTPCPAIVDDATWAAAQRAMTTRKRMTTPIRGGADFILTGFMRCGMCGAAMSGRWAKWQQGLKYECGLNRRGGKSACRPNAVAQDDVLNALFSGIFNRFCRPEIIDVIRDQFQIAKKSRPKILQQLVSQLSRVESQIVQARMRLVEVDREFICVVQSRLRELEQHRAEIVAQVDATRIPSGVLQADMERRTEEAIDQFRRLASSWRVATPQEIREFLTEIVDGRGITVWSEESGGRWNFAKGHIRFRESSPTVSPFTLVPHGNPWAAGESERFSAGMAFGAGGVGSQ